MVRSEVKVIPPVGCVVTQGLDEIRDGILPGNPFSCDRSAGTKMPQAASSLTTRGSGLDVVTAPVSQDVRNRPLKPYSDIPSDVYNA